MASLILDFSAAADARARRQSDAAGKPEPAVGAPSDGAAPQGIGNAELVGTLTGATGRHETVGFPRKAFTCQCGSPFHKILDTGRVQCGACGVIHPEIRWERRT